MKKLILGGTVMALAIAGNAASFSWKTYVGQAVYQSGTTTKLSGATAYLFDSSVVAQTVLLDGLLNGSKSITSYTSLASGQTTSAGALSGAKFETLSVDTGNTLSAYFAIVSGDDVFISSVASAEAQANSTSPLTFTGLSSPSKSAAIEFADASSYTGAGWYTAVPEPTSGLLMFLGMAGLALRRRRV